VSNSCTKLLIDSLFELVCIQKYTLKESLEIMIQTASESKNKRFTKACKEILAGIENGNRLSASLINCETVYFDPTSVSFISLAEITGNIESSIKFLKDRLERIEIGKQNIFCACIYPICVCFLGFVLSIVFVLFGQKIIPENLYKFGTAEKVKLMESLLFVLCFVILGFYLIVKNLSQNKLYESFLTVGFLVESGLNIGASFNYAVYLLGKDSTEGKLFNTAKERLELGMDLKSAFQTNNKSISKIPGFDMAISYAQKGGLKTNVFEKIALSINSRDEKKRKVVLGLIEPFLIGSTGLFLIALIMNLLMPVLMNMGEVI